MKQSTPQLFFWWCFFFNSLYWIFIAACRLSLVVASRGNSLVVLCRPFIVVASLIVEHGILGVCASVVVAPSLQSTGSIVVYRLSCSAACGIFPEELNPCLLHWQVDSLPLSDQGSPTQTVLIIFIFWAQQSEDVLIISPSYFFQFSWVPCPHIIRTLPAVREQEMKWLSEALNQHAAELGTVWLLFVGKLRSRQRLPRQSLVCLGQPSARQAATACLLYVYSLCVQLLLLEFSGNYKSFMKVKVLVAQLCPTLCDPMDCSLPGSSVHGILQARILEWVAIHFSRGCS